MNGLLEKIPLHNFDLFLYPQTISLLILLLLTPLLLLLFLKFLKLLLRFTESQKEFELIEVKPLRITEQAPYSTQQLFSFFHGLSRHSSPLHRLLGIHKTFSFEIVSTKKEGIRYLIRVPEGDGDLIQKSLLSYLPGISVTRTTDYIASVKQQLSIDELSLSSHFAFPLKTPEDLEKHDPIAYVTGSMTKLAPDELAGIQVVVSAADKQKIADTGRVSNLIKSGQDIFQITGSSGPQIHTHSLLLLLIRILVLPIGILVFILTDGKNGPFLTISSRSLKGKQSPYQKEAEQLVKDKLSQDLFFTSLRTVVVSPSKTEQQKRKRGLLSSLLSLSNSEYQSLKLIHKWLLFAGFKRYLFNKRLLNPLKCSLMSSSELSSLYHFPFTKITKTEDLLKEHSKQLPAPHSLKKASMLDIVFAENHYGGSVTPIGLSKDERRRHMYILGATGTGKSTMLLSMIEQDVMHKKGVGVVDPHGDLIEQVLKIIPDKRVEDVVYFNPDDIAYPIGINLLELTPGLGEDDAIREKEYIAESVISLFHKIYTEKYSGPRMEYILRNAIHTAFTVPDATLFTVYKLLINAKFRKKVVRGLTDENLIDFWKYEFNKAGDFQKVKMISPITNKIGRFLFSPTAKRILEQPRSTINFEEIINEGKILLCNVSKGRIGEDNSEVFGVVIMAKLQLAALKRARRPMKQRKDFYLYVDEFQNFATPSFAQILSEARKYRLNAILAHQTTSQLKDRSLVHVTLANTGTVICFRTANPEDEKLMLPQFRPYIEPGEIAGLPSFRFYMRLGALNPEEPFSGITTPVEIKKRNGVVDKVIEHSRINYAIKYQDKPTENTRHTIKKQGQKATVATVGGVPRTVSAD